MNALPSAWQRRNIVLTGFMGTGKTTVGRLLAERLGFDFVDTDAIIEAVHGPISAIFAELGESAFRTIEQQTAAELADREHLVIATGGRMMLDDANVAALSRNGRVFCLVTTADDILGRVTADRSRVERPLLAVDDPEQRIVDLLAERAPAYRRFAQISTLGRPAADIADELAAWATTLPERVASDPGRPVWWVGAAVLPLLRDIAGIDGSLTIVADASAAAILPQCPVPDRLVTIGDREEVAARTIADALGDQLDSSTTLVAVGHRTTYEATRLAASEALGSAKVIYCPTGLDLAARSSTVVDAGRLDLGVLDVAVLQTADTGGDLQVLLADALHAVRARTTG